MPLAYSTLFFLVLFMPPYKREASWTWSSMSLPKVSTFLIIIFSSTLSAFFFLSSGALLMCEFFYLKISHKSQTLSSLFFISFSSFLWPHNFKWHVFKFTDAFCCLLKSAVDAFFISFIVSFSSKISDFFLLFLSLLNFSFCFCIGLLILSS